MLSLQQYCVVRVFFFFFGNDSSARVLVIFFGNLGLATWPID